MNDQDQPASSSPVCLITGGSSGIGLATAKCFAANGYRLAICGRDANKLDAAESEIKAAVAEGTVSVFSMSVDLADTNKAVDFVNAAADHFGRVDVLVNNAALAPLMPFDEVTESSFEAITNVNLRSVFYLTQAAWKQMKQQKVGVIVNVSSMAAVGPFPGFSLYGASKAWIELLTQALASEGTDHGIRLYAIRPGAVETPLLRGLFPDFPAEQCVSSDTIAQQILKCVDDPENYTSGDVIPMTNQ
ncbi:MAG: SDR family oxidoreductase [Planctomycetota bacterium]